MSAAEFNTWMAYYYLQDEKKRSDLENQIADEATLHEKASKVRSFFGRFVKRNK